MPICDLPSQHSTRRYLCEGERESWNSYRRHEMLSRFRVLWLSSVKTTTCCSFLHTKELSCWGLHRCCREDQWGWWPGILVALQGTLQGICEEKVRRRKPTTGYMVMFVSEMVRNMNSCRRSNIGRTLIFVLGGGQWRCFRWGEL